MKPAERPSLIVVEPASDHRTVLLLFVHPVALSVAVEGAVKSESAKDFLNYQELSRTLETTVNLVVSAPNPGWEGLVRLVDAALIRDAFGAPGSKDWLYILCGPPAMMEVVEDALIDIGVPTRQILSERFSYD